MMMADSVTSTRLLSAYGITPPVTAKPSKRRRGPAKGGIALEIYAADDAYFGCSIRLTIGRRRSSSPCPLNEFEAARLVEEFRLAHLLPDRFREDMTLVHLLVKCSHLYNEAGLTALRLHCHLTPRGYRVDDVEIISKSELKARERLAGDAHDRKAVFAWRRTARAPHQHARK